MRLSASLAPVCLVSVLALAGCNSVQQQGAKTVTINLQGRAMGGEQPITDSTIQLYAVGTTTDGGGATALINQITTPVTTSDGTGVVNSNANAGNNNNQLTAGSFTITGDYTCPSASTLVYLAAIGGNPGIGTNNAQEQIAALGQCGNLSSSTYITVNEITTVGTVKALQPYMSNASSTYASVSSTPPHAAALATAFNTASEYVNVQYGQAPGPNLPAGYDADSNDLRALANVVQNCVNSNGSTGNGTNCGTFFTDAQGTAANPPADTVTALYDVFSDPTNNVTPIFNLQGTTPAFEPTNNTAPADWTLPILQTPATPVINPNGGTITSSQNITITDTDTDGTNAIYYTTDGSTPSATNGTLYAGPFTIIASATVEAIDIDDNRLSSSVASSTFTVSTGLTPTVSLSSLTVATGSTTGVTLTATGNDTGSVVTFGVTSPADGTFSPTTCTIASGSCSVTYTPSGTLSAGTYSNDLTASFSAYGSYIAASATSTLTVAAPYTETVLHSFTAAVDGKSPYFTNLIQGTDGNFYGTTETGGPNGGGTVFELVPNGTNSTLTALYSFSGGDGRSPYSSLVQGADGNFYGMTETGGPNGGGTVFELVPNGTNSTLTALYSFSGGDGRSPYSSLVQGADGNFYGMTPSGGANGVGEIFELVPNGTNSTLTILYSFSGSPDGATPYGNLVQGADGNFYGMTTHGGDTNSTGDGIIFELVPNGTNSTLTILHTFNGTGGSADGANPYGSLVQGTDGNFYGMAENGGASSLGTAFQLVPNGTNSTFTVLHSFAGGTSDGSRPQGSLVQGTDGNFYGLTSAGGSALGYGTAFKLTPNGTNSTVTLMRSFAGGTSDGRVPYGSLVQGADGNFYGETSSAGANSNAGIVFEIAVVPALPAPVSLSAPATVTHGNTFSLSYAVSNAYAASPNDGTLEQCFAGVYNGSGVYTGLGTFTGKPSSQNTTLTAPATTGTYTLGVTCGGMESSTTSLTVQ